MRCLVDVPGEKLPSAATGELAEYLRTTVAPQVQPSPGVASMLVGSAGQRWLRGWQQFTIEGKQIRLHIGASVLSGCQTRRLEPCLGASDKHVYQQ